MESLTPWLALFASIYALDAARYFFGVLITLIPLFVLFRHWSNRRRIQNRQASGKDIRREIGYSLATMGIYALVGVATFEGVANGPLQIYSDVNQFGWAYAVLSLPLILVLHDAYFYWVHRAMHHKKLFRFFHRVHHLSRTPTPWAAYSFAPGEAFMMTLFVPLLLWAMPVHEIVLFAFLGIMIVRNAQGHSGVEFHPRWWVTSPLDVLTTVTHHDLHHQRFNGNYGLYFTWWDRWMGTEVADYREEFYKVIDASALVTPLSVDKSAGQHQS